MQFLGGLLGFLEQNQKYLEEICNKLEEIAKFLEEILESSGLTN
jgi:hypothetical protein